MVGPLKKRAFLGFPYIIYVFTKTDVDLFFLIPKITNNYYIYHCYQSRGAGPDQMKIADSDPTLQIREIRIRIQEVNNWDPDS